MQYMFTFYELRVSPPKESRFSKLFPKGAILTLFFLQCSGMTINDLGQRMTINDLGQRKKNPGEGPPSFFLSPNVGRPKNRIFSHIKLLFCPFVL